MKDKNQEQNGFSYTYSAKEQEELQKIREKYTAPTDTEDKMERLRRLDASVTQTAQTIAITFGVIGALMLGLGMSLIMTDLGATLGITQTFSNVLGILIGVIGGALAGLAYPMYHAVRKKERERVAPEILRLTDELMK